MKPVKRKLLVLSKVRYFVIYTLVVFVSYLPSTASADRFDPPPIGQPLLQFEARFDAGIFNVDFLVAHIVNNARKTTREVSELISNSSETLSNNTEVFTNNTTGSTAAGSVIIPPGTSADTIIIINQNEGDSIAIQR